MKTIAERRREFVRAKSAAPALAAIHPRATAYELILAKLNSDKRRLKQVQSVERKIAVKRELLPDYEAWVSGVLAGDKGGQDDVVATIMVWRIDVGDIAGALLLADYVLRHGLALPDYYKRTPGTLIAEEIADAALREFSVGRTFDLAVLVRTEELTSDADMPDEVRAKLMKALGLAYEARGLFDVAAGLLVRAYELNDKVGVKKDIERVQRAHKAREAEQAEAAPAEEAPAETPVPAPQNPQSIRKRKK
jgi:hypothetical protein